MASGENHALQPFNVKSHNNDDNDPNEDLTVYVKHFFITLNGRKTVLIVTMELRKEMTLAVL